MRPPFLSVGAEEDSYELRGRQRRADALEMAVNVADEGALDPLVDCPVLRPPFVILPGPRELPVVPLAHFGHGCRCVFVKERERLVLRATRPLFGVGRVHRSVIGYGEDRRLVSCRNFAEACHLEWNALGDVACDYAH